MYRDPRAEAQARIDAAVNARTGTKEELEELRDALEVLREQLKEKGIATPPSKVLAPSSHVFEMPTQCRLSLADTLRAADEIEHDEARLRAEVVELTQLVTLYGDRLSGKVTDLPLGAPPRSVPIVYLLAEALPAWLILILPAAAIIGEMSAAGSSVSYARFTRIAVLLLPLVPLGIRAYRRMWFLGRCRVAHVALESETQTATKNTNVPMRFARGWKISREAFTGYTVRSVLHWHGDDGSSGKLTLRGTPYEKGIVLHDENVALSVVELACAPRPDVRGEWERRLPWPVWLRLAVVVAIVCGLVAFALRGV